ncbi:MAG TPA: ATP-binding protein [Myxococcaceae bacterium]
MTSPQPLDADASAERNRINLGWLLRLRWGAFAGQAALTLWCAWSGAVKLPLGPMLGVLALGAASNAAGEWLKRRAASAFERLIAAAMLVDTGLLTALLYLSGGPFNPFSTLYLVNVALGTALLPTRWALGQALFSLMAFASLFWLARLPSPDGLMLPGHTELMEVHFGGMWVAFATATGFIVYFVGRARRALDQRERELEVARDLHARQEKLAALGTLAAGAAHELSTPLGTVAVVAEELRRTLAAQGASGELLEDLQLLRSQVARCRSILEQMGARFGEPSGEGLVEIELGACAEAARGQLDEGGQARLQIIEEGVEDARVRVAPRALQAAVLGLIRNALGASSGPVRLRLLGGPVRVGLEISDQGTGMAPDVLRRAGEPFFTTKRPGQGMGLGLFLARATAEQFGGTLELSSEEGVGTRARLWIPAALSSPETRDARAPGG